MALAPIIHTPSDGDLCHDGSPESTVTVGSFSGLCSLWVWTNME